MVLWYNVVLYDSLKARQRYHAYASKYHEFIHCYCVKWEYNILVSLEIHLHLYHTGENKQSNSQKSRQRVHIWPRTKMMPTLVGKYKIVTRKLNFTLHAYTLRTLHACCRQPKFRKLKIRKSSARALFLYNCTPNISRSADASVSVAGLIYVLNG